MRKALTAVVGLLAIAAGTTAALFVSGDTEAAAPPAPSTTATAAIARQDLVDTKTVDGALTYAGERQISTDAAGTVTSVAKEGSVVRRGRPLLKIDRKPVVLLYGSLPLYRPLRQGVDDGPDVEQLERNLKALGYGDDLTVDEHFSYATYLAVKEWQKDNGLPQTGQVDATQAVFLPSAVRVTDAKVSVGDRTAPGRPALTISGLRRLVHVDLNTDDQTLVKKGARVTVKLPGGERIKGRVHAVGTVAKSGASGQGQGNDSTTVDVDITLDKTPKTGLDQAPVEVELVSERHKNVLAVPVEALLALREGGFGVEIVENGAARLVAVKTGAFGGGMVEITGAGLTEGMRVGVPES
ncbi:efflux RND transporter periplasmic adaptor subunit [Microtetraspora malaysiensis]|uniref:efflux RND transporter periplasmic adaptor subunit n=1 Tax=Microtetraspora malaysiensis TaxID=161358 RepID=UPI003D90910B